MRGSFPWKYIRYLSLAHCNEVYFEEISNVVKDSLFELAFHDNNKHNNYAKAMITKAAETYSNLQVISSYLITEDPSFRLLDYLNDTAQISNFRLTSLSLAWKLETSSFSRICELLPALTSLMVDPEVYYDYVNILDATTKHCPALEILHYKRDSVKQPLYTTYTPESPISTNNGLKVLVLHPVATWDYVKDADRLLTLLLQRGSRKLETLDIDLGVIEGTEFTSIETLTQFGAPSLERLNLYAWNDSSLGPERLANLISSCPSLTNITFSGLNMGYINRTLNALEGSESIKLLKMRFHHYTYLPIAVNEGVVSISNIASFFKRTRRIHDFSLNCSGSHCNLTSKSWLIFGLAQAISFSTVKMLDLRTHILKNDVLLGVLKSLKGSQVQTLKIQVASEIGNPELDAFAEIQHLTHLIIYDDQFHFKEVHICRLLEQWQKPQMLVVEVRCNNSRRFIKGYKPDLATMRPIKDQIDDLEQRYSIQSLCAEFPTCNQQRCVKTHQRCNQFYGSY
ncbi:hypothetical protein BJV82DRAFT_250256 [Fennellomyces sp. T-0311]|nr:hypothetical protein BJV82DRAFT_250256 [Fennellomyces sp. T-0311]